MHSLRVLLVEDDASVRRFFEMVCADLPVQLRCAGSARDALADLQTHRADLLITDLMLPGEHGLWLIEQVRALQDPVQPSVRMAVFSADTSRQTAQAIDRAGVWRVLRKPASVAEIEACIHAARAELNAAAPAAPRASAAASAPTAPAGPGAADAHPVDTHFGGNRALFDAFAQSTRARFPADRAEGADALQQGDAAALERLAHSLKTVLRMLGDAPGGTCAAELEALARGLIDAGRTDPPHVRASLGAAWAAMAAALAAQASRS